MQKIKPLLTELFNSLGLLIYSLFFDAGKEYSTLLHATRKKLRRISKTRALLCSKVQIIAYAFLYIKLFSSPGNVYEMAGWLVGLTIVILFSTIALFKDAITSIEDGIGNKIKIIISLAFLVGIYFCSAVGSASMNEIFPFSSSNTKYALSLLTFLVFSYALMSILNIFLWLAIIISWIYFIKYFWLRKLSSRIAPLAIIALNIYAPVYAIEKLNVSGFGNFLYILASRVAVDYDSMPADLCISTNTLKELRGLNEAEYRVAAIPVSTAVDTGYIFMVLRKLPVGKKIQDYTESDKYQYMPTTLYKVSCDQRSNTDKISDTY